MTFLYDFLVEFVAAFLGFLFALFLTGISDRHNEVKQKKTIIRGLRNELEDIHDSVLAYTSHNIPLKHRIAIPTWDALQYSGGILSLMENDYYDEIISVYSTIKRYNEERSTFDETEENRTLTEIVNLSENVLALLPKESKDVKNTELKNKR